MSSTTLQERYLQFIRNMRFDLGSFRAYAILSVLAIPFLRFILPANADDPMWLRLAISAAMLAGLLFTFIGQPQRAHLRLVNNIANYVVALWAIYLVWANSFSVPYLINFFGFLVQSSSNFTRTRSWTVFSLVVLALSLGACIGVSTDSVNLWPYFPLVLVCLGVSGIVLSFRITIKSELSRQQHLVSSILESGPDAIVMADAATLEVRESNQLAAKMFGLTGLNNTSQLHELLTEWLQEYLSGENRKDKMGRSQTMISTLDHRSIWGEVVITEVSSGRGKELLVSISDITDKQAISRRLQLSDDILQKVDHLVLVCDAEANVVYATPSIKAMLGYEPAEILGQGWWELKRKSGENPLEDQEYVRRLARGLVPPKQDLYEGRHIDNQGKEQFILWKDSVTTSGYVMGVGMLNTRNRRDETIRKVVFNIAEGSSKAQNPGEFYRFIHQEIRRLIDTPNFYVAVYDAEHDEVSFPYYSDKQDSVVAARVSRKRKAGSGLTEYGIKRKRPVLLLKQDIHLMQEEGVVKVMGSVPEVWLGVPMVHDDQVVGLITIQDYEQSSAYSEDDLAIVNFIATQVAQFVAKLQADEALRQSEERFRSIYNQAAVGIAQLTPEGKFIQVNQKMEEIFGYNAEELASMVPADFTHPDDVDLGREELIDVLDGKRNSYSKEKRYRHKDGSPVYALLNVSAYREDGEPVFIISVYEDITEKKRAQGETELLLRLSSGLNTAQTMDDAVAVTLQELAGFDDWGVAQACWLDQGGTYQTCSERFQEDAELGAIALHDLCRLSCRTESASAGKILWLGDPEMEEFADQLAPAFAAGMTAAAYLPIVHEDKVIVGFWLLSRTGSPNRRSLEKLAGAVKAQLQAVHIRKMAEAARIESENRYRAITQAAFEGIAIYQEDQILDCNSAFAKIFAYEKSELTGMGLADLIYDESPEDVVVQIAQGEKGEVEFMGRQKSGDSVHLEAISREDSWQGQPARILAIRDITSQKLMEESREAARLDARFRAYIQNSSEIIKIIDAEGRIQYCSPSYNKIFNRAGDTVIGQSLTDQLEAGERDSFKAKLQSVFESPGQTAQTQLRYIHPDGGIRVLQVTLTNLIEDPMIKGVLVSEGDITHVIDAQEAMRESEARFKLLFERSPDAIFVESEDGFVLDVNEAACLLHEMTREELVGRHVSTLVPQDKVSQAESSFPDLMSGKIAYLESESLTKSGKVVGVEIRCSVVNFQNNPALLLLVRDISERKKAEGLLKESEERFRALVEHATEAIFVFDVDSDRLVEVNFNAERLFGRSREELMTISPAALRPESQADGQPSALLEKQHQELALRGETVVFEWLNLRADGTEVPCEVRMNRFPSSTRRLVRGSVTDITARKQAELHMQHIQEMLRIHNERLIELAASPALNSGDLDLAFEAITRAVSELLQVSNVGIWLFDKDEEFLVCHKQYDAETDTFLEGETRRVSEYPLYFEYIRTHRVLAVEDTLTAPEVVEFRERSVIPKGIASALDAPFRHGGKVAGVIWTKQLHKRRVWEAEELNLVATMSDMCTLALQSWERKKAENALRVSERNNKALLDGIPDLIVRISDTGTVLDYKQSDQQTMIRFESHAIGSLVDQMLPEAMAEKLIASARKAIEQGEIQQIESEVTWHTGEAMDYETRIVRSGPQEVLVIIRDVTERKRTEKELIKRNFELDSFVYRASHDLKAPLNSLMGLISLVESETQEPAVVAYIKMMNKSVVKLDTFIRDLADFSRNARLELEHSLIDWESLMNETLENLQFADGADRIEKHIHIQYEGAFHSDPVRIGIIFNNLISNAIKYQNLQRKDSRVDITITRQGSNAVISIADNGIGIAREHQPKVYNLFFRASIQSYGSGMGMYIVKNAIDRLKGSIQLESEEGNGSVFTVTLPDLGPAPDA
ncbi:MAG: PAS domain S-box protein [Bacteroidia bacterium]